jgi:hypothetical protein
VLALRFDLIRALVDEGGCTERMTIADQVLFALAVEVDEMRARANGEGHGRGVRLMKKIRLMLE